MTSSPRPIPGSPASEASPGAPPWVGPGFAEFVGIVALMMAVTAMSIDNLLPAFPLIQERFSVADPNSLQLLVYVYMIGFGVAQIVYGPVSDAIGRRPTLLISLGIYTAGCILSMLAPSYEWLLAPASSRAWGRPAGASSRPRSCATASRGARWRA